MGVEKRYNVMVIDDSKFMCNYIAALLDGTEFQVACKVHNGRDVVNNLLKYNPDIVLLDIIMPDKTGDEVLKEIIKAKPEIKVVMISSAGTEQMVERCLELGAMSFLQKPFNKEILLQTLRDILEG